MEIFSPYFSTSREWMWRGRIFSDEWIFFGGGFAHFLAVVSNIFWRWFRITVWAQVGHTLKTSVYFGREQISKKLACILDRRILFYLTVVSHICLGASWPQAQNKRVFCRGAPFFRGGGFKLFLAVVSHRIGADVSSI